MFRSTFTALVKRQSRCDKVEWFGMGIDGTMALGLRYYNGHDSVKIYRAGIFGSIHEIADIEFAGTPLTPIFNSHRHEIFWLHQVDTEFLKPLYLRVYTLVIFNMISGQLTRYFSTPEEHLENGNLIQSVDDVMVYLIQKFDDDEFHLFTIYLSAAEESFSLNFVAKIPLILNIAVSTLSTVFSGNKLIFLNNGTKFEYLLCYEILNKRWVMENVHCECIILPENQTDVLVCGRFFFSWCFGSDEISLLRLDSFNFTWKVVFTDFYVEPVPPDCDDHWWVSSDSAVVVSFGQPETAIEPFMKIRVGVHCKKFLPLKDLCLRALWQIVQYFFPDSTDHEILDRLALSSMVDGCKYFGNRFH